MSQLSKRLGKSATTVITLMLLAIIAATGYLIWLCIALTNTKQEIPVNHDKAVSLPAVNETIVTAFPTESAEIDITDVSSAPLMPTAAEEPERTTAPAPTETKPEINTENWKQAYYDFIIKDAEDSEYSRNNNVDYYSYHLVYLDADEIPELWIDYAISAAGCRLVTVSDGEIHNTHLGCGWISYFDCQNLFCHSYGKTGSPTIYSLEHGSLVTLASGAQYGEEYIWNDAPVSKEAYYQNLHKYIDLETAKDTMQPEYTYSEILEYLSNKSET